MMMMMIENSIKFKIIKTQVSKISQVELSFFSTFSIFQNLVRRGVRGVEGLCRNMKAERKNSKLEIKVFFKVLKFLSLFSSISMIFRCEEHLYKRLRWLVRRSVRPSVPHDARLRGKLVTSRLLREEEEEEETDYVAIPLRRDSFAPRD